MKYLEKEFVIVNDLETWDLLILDEEGNELKRLKGRGVDVPSYARAIKTKYCEDSDILLWLNSPSGLSLVDLGDFSEHELEDFWRYKGFSVYGTAVTSNRDASRIAGIGFIHELGNTQTLHLWKNSAELVVLEMRHIHSDVAAWLSLEISRDSSLVFVGGAESLALSSGDGFIFAIEFEKQLAVVGSKQFGEEEGKLGCVNLIRRYEGETNDDILMIGGSGAILVVLYLANKFHTI